MKTVCGQVGERKLLYSGLHYFIILPCIDVSIQRNRELADEGVKGNSVAPLCQLCVTKPTRWQLKE